jgi:tetratricopeptide (TPR) repeat protein
VARGALLGVSLGAVSLATAFVHALRVGACDLSGGVSYFALTAWAGCVMGGVWGAFVGEAALLSALGRWFVVIAAVLGPLGSAGVSVYRFATSPMIFAYDPFVGYFSGTLYDTVIDAGTPMLTYRLGSFTTLAAVTLGASLVSREPLGFVRDSSSRGRAVLLAIAVGCSLGITAYGTSLGHFSTVESIVAGLGAEKHGERCDVVYPATTREQDAALLLKDCEEQLWAVEKRLGARGPERVRAYFFRDADDKKLKMGAAHTYIAKPWRAEVYLQLGGYPHPVLAHELAHVVAGSFGRGPFRIAGSLHGWVPNPGLIEGVAVAAAPDDDDLTGAEWARAMKDIGLLPRMQRVFSLGFLGENSSKSYTLAGAFVAWVGERFGFDVVRAWYGGGDVTSLTHASWESLEAQFQAYLDEKPLPPAAASVARAKFARPGVFGRRCPHAVDALRHEADLCRDTQRFNEALELYRAALAKDPLDFASRKDAAVVERRHGDHEKGRAALLEMARADERSVPRTVRDRAREALADAQFVDGDYDGARQAYEALLADTVDEDVARTLEVKMQGAREPSARDAVRALLIGSQDHGPDAVWGSLELGRWEGSDATGLSAYLVGRTLAQRGFFDAAARAFDTALTRPLPTARIEREALRQRIIVACALRDREALSHAKTRIDGVHDPFVGTSGARRSTTLAMIASCLR